MAAAKKKFPLAIALGVVDRVTRPMRSMRKVIDRVWEPTRKLRAGLSKLSRAAGLPAMVKGFKRLGMAVGGVLTKVMALGGRLAFLGVAGVAGAVAMVRSVGNAGDNIAKTSAKLGIGVEALQEYRFAAERAGVPIATFDMAMQRMGRRVGEAANGLGEARMALKVLGIDARDAEGNVRSIESLMPELADKLSKVASENERNALAMKLFDSEGVALVNMLQDGSKGLEEMRERARELGLVMSEEDTKAAEEFTDAQTDLGSALTGVKNVIGGALMPQLTGLSDKLTSFIAEHRPAIQAWTKEFAASLPERLRQIREGLQKLKKKFDGIKTTVAPIVERVGGLNLVLGILAVLVLGPLIGSLVALVPAIYAVGVALLTTPIGWIILGITALIAIGVYLAKKWDWVGAMFKGIWAFIAGAFKFGWEMIKWLVSLMLKPIGWIKKGWGALTGFFSDMWDGIKGVFTSGVSWVTNKVKGLIGWLPDWMTGDLSITANPGPSRPQFADPVSPERIAGASGTAAVRISFDDLPAGARIVDEGNDGVDLDLDYGPSMGPT